MQRRRHDTLWIVPLLCTGIVFVMAFLTMQAVGWRSDGERTWDMYLGFPASILRGQGYRECPVEGYLWCEPSVPRQAYRLPIYGLFLTALLGIAGLDDPLPKIRLAHVVLAGVLVFLTTHYAARLWGRAAALLAGIVLLLGSPLLYIAPLLMTEMLFAVLVIAVLYGWTFYPHRPFWLGVLLALAMLTKGTLVFTAPLLVLFIPRRYWWRLALGFGLIIGAWTIRNYLILNSVIPFSTGSGAVLWGANNPIAWANADGQWLQMPDYPGYERFLGLSEVEWDRAQQRAALEFVLSQSPGRWIQIALTKLRLLFAANTEVYLLLFILGGFYAVGLLTQAIRRAHRRLLVRAAD